MALELIDECWEVGLTASFDIKVNTDMVVSHGGQTLMQLTYPSSTAEPNGRVLLEPPRNRFHMVSAKPEA